MQKLSSPLIQGLYVHVECASPCILTFLNTISKLLREQSAREASKLSSKACHRHAQALHKLEEDRAKFEAVCMRRSLFWPLALVRHFHE